MLRREPARKAEILDMQIDSRYELVEEVSSAAKAIAERMGFNQEAVGWIELAVREAVINAIKHGNKGDESKPVDIRFALNGDELIIYVRDRGAGFDMDLLPDPLDPKNLLSPCGRGVFFMRAFMDEVECFAHPEGGNVVRMSKCKRND